MTPQTGESLLRRSDGADSCDDCGRPMPLTGAQLCTPCEKDDEARRACIVCGGAKLFLDVPTCSEACEVVLDGWPEP